MTSDERRWSCKIDHNRAGCVVLHLVDVAHHLARREHAEVAHHADVLRDRDQSHLGRIGGTARGLGCDGETVADVDAQALGLGRKQQDGVRLAQGPQVTQHFIFAAIDVFTLLRQGEPRREASSFLAHFRRCPLKRPAGSLAPRRYEQSRAPDRRRSRRPRREMSSTIVRSAARVRDDSGNASVCFAL